MSALRGAEAVATDIRYGTPLSSKVDVRHGDHDALDDAGVVLITGRQREKRAAPRIAAIRKGG
jgi:malate/lactate dehydrogenase